MTDLLIIISIFITFFTSSYLYATYRKYKRITNEKGISGAEVAREILKRNNIEDIYVVMTDTELSDHYDPSRKTIKLSPDIYNGTTVASLAVAAHEVGHVLQEKNNYGFYMLRSKLVPYASFSSSVSYIVIGIGLFTGILNLIYLGIAALLIILAFQFVTLPVEFNASKLAYEQLINGNVINEDEGTGVKSMLNAAALTYVAAVAVTLINILRLILFSNRRGD